MRKIPVYSNYQEYARPLRSYSEGRVGLYSDRQLRLAPENIRICTGNKPGYGGGPSRYGFIKNGSVVIGSVWIEGRVKASFASEGRRYNCLETSGGVRIDQVAKVTTLSGVQKPFPNGKPDGGIDPPWSASSEFAGAPARLISRSLLRRYSRVISPNRTYVPRHLV
jgi:hypothetical protein